MNRISSLQNSNKTKKVSELTKRFNDLISNLNHKSHKNDGPIPIPRWRHHNTAQSILPTVEPPKPTNLSNEINILILGETGVGKSTWINAFTCYLFFSTIDESKEHDLLAVIPSSFTVVDDEYKMTKIETTKDHNENTILDGAPGTQSTRFHTFPIENTLFRLIDTPGIGDTRGLEQDQENFENILQSLTHIKELHAILILLKPDNSKVNVMFQFCIQELLAHLDTSASQNIIFCFTNTKSTDYKPGQTLPALISLLNRENYPNFSMSLTRNTMFCTDSEAYKFLAANKFGVKYDKKKELGFAESWEHSRNEILRLINTIQSIKPHDIKHTLSINNARKTISQLTTPLGEIAMNIHANIRLNEVEKERLEELKKREINISEEIGFSKITTMSFPLKVPRTVCTDKACTTKEKIGTYEEVVHNVCHDNCRRLGITNNQIGAPNLKRCSVMTFLTNTCRICGHSYKSHMNITYSYHHAMENSLEQEKSVELLNITTDKNIVMDRIKFHENRIAQYKDEEKVITETYAFLANFLKEKAIAPFCHERKNYLAYMIKKENSDTEESRLKIEYLKNQIEVYDKEFEEMQKKLKAKTSNEYSFELENVEKHINNLYSLPLIGMELKQIMESSEKTKQLIFENIEHRHTIDSLNLKKDEKQVKNNSIWSAFVNFFKRK